MSNNLLSIWICNTQYHNNTCYMSKHTRVPFY